MLGYCRDSDGKIASVVEDSEGCAMMGFTNLRDLGTYASLVCEDCSDTYSDDCDEVDVCTVEYGDCECYEC
jgi:hypothetical protein